MSKVSVLIPSRGEQYLIPTVRDVLTNASGECEAVVVLDGGPWPEGWANIVEESKAKGHLIITIRHAESLGMRASLNRAYAASSGAYILKSDAHCLFSQGWDEVLTADIDDNMVVVPRRFRLDAAAWTISEDGRPPIDAHYISYPFENPGEVGGFQGRIWNERAKARKNILFDDEMSSQGSCYFMTRKHRERLGDLNEERYGTFTHEFSEVGLQTWLGGGRVMCNKRVHYAHLHKSSRGYSLSKRETSAGAANSLRFWMLDQWKQRKRDFRWLLEHFISQSGSVPTWPVDLDVAFRYAHDVLGKNQSR